MPVAKRLGCYRGNEGGGGRWGARSGVLPGQEPAPVRGRSAPRVRGHLHFFKVFIYIRERKGGRTASLVPTIHAFIDGFLFVS